MSDYRQDSSELFIAYKEVQGFNVECLSTDDKFDLYHSREKHIILINDKPYFFVFAKMSHISLEELEKVICAVNKIDYSKLCERGGFSGVILIIASDDQSPLFDENMLEAFLNSYNDHNLMYWGCGNSEIREIYFCDKVLVEGTWQFRCHPIADASTIARISWQFARQEELRQELGMPSKVVPKEEQWLFDSKNKFIVNDLKRSLKQNADKEIDLNLFESVKK